MALRPASVIPTSPLSEQGPLLQVRLAGRSRLEGCVCDRVVDPAVGESGRGEAGVAFTARSSNPDGRPAPLLKGGASPETEEQLEARRGRGSIRVISYCLAFRPSALSAHTHARTHALRAPHRTTTPHDTEPTNGPHSRHPEAKRKDPPWSLVTGPNEQTPGDKGKSSLFGGRGAGTSGTDATQGTSTPDAMVREPPTTGRAGAGKEI